MNDRNAANTEHETESHRRAMENEEPSEMIPAKREGEVVDGAGKRLEHRDDRSPLDGAMEG